MPTIFIAPRSAGGSDWIRICTELIIRMEALNLLSDDLSSNVGLQELQKCMDDIIAVGGEAGIV